MAEPSPGLRPSQMHYPVSSPIDESPFPMLSDAEEAEMDRARRSGFRDELNSDDEHDSAHGRTRYDRDMEDDSGEGGRSMGSSGYDSHHRLMRSHSHSEHEGDGRPLNHRRGHSGHHGHGRHGNGHGLDGPGGPMSLTGAKSRFDFGAMEDYAAQEREDLAKADGTWVPTVPGPTGSPALGPGAGIRQRTASASRFNANASVNANTSEEDVGQPGGQSYDTSMERTHTASAYGDDHETAFSPKGESEINSAHAFHRRRQRKLSQSNPLHRRGKLALFEGFGSQGGGHDGDITDSPAVGGVAPLKAPRQAKNPLSAAKTNGFTAYTDAAPGHDRPYRFSFYSNNLPVTIHARTLAELPAEGQTFEDLFKGRATMDDVRGPGDAGAGAGAGAGAEVGSIQSGMYRNGRETPSGQDSTMAQPNAKMSMLARAAGAAAQTGAGGAGAQPQGSPDDEPEAFTWWLDVLSPTDEEMRMLSKVGRDAVFTRLEVKSCS